MKCFLPFIVSIAIALSGCSATLINTKIEDQSSSSWKIANVRAFESDGVINVSGKMRFPYGTEKRGEQIDISVYTQDGEMILQKSVPIHRHLLHKKGYYFSVEFVENIPLGAYITAELHK